MGYSMTNRQTDRQTDVKRYKFGRQTNIFIWESGDINMRQNKSKKCSTN